MTAAAVGRLVALLCVSGALGAVAGPSAATPALQIVRYTTVLNQGGVWSLTARVVSATPRCSVTLRRPNGSTTTASVPVRAGVARWAIDFSPAAHPGSWQARVTCGGAATTVSFAVRRAPLPVIVESFGFAQRPRLSDAGSSFGIGAVARNRSRFTAHRVTVVFDLLDAQGGVVVTSRRTVAAIPAGTTFFVGAAESTTTPEHAMRIRASVRVREWSRRRVRLPVVSNVRLVRGQFGTEVHGSVRNVTRSTLSSRADVHAVLFDGAGTVIGGGSALLQTAVGPGARTAFRVVPGVEDTPFDRVASIRVSVEPDDT
jgi:hypothetical protein